MSSLRDSNKGDIYDYSGEYHHPTRNGAKPKIPSFSVLNPNPIDSRVPGFKPSKATLSPEVQAYLARVNPPPPEGTFQLGKHKGKPFQEVVTSFPGYIRWLLESCDSEHMREDQDNLTRWIGTQ